jgi:murein DD-endopeptidase MepM/ murein hydrolase activator NlpD
MNRQGPVLFEAPLAHEHASHCNCRECRNNYAQAFAPGWAEREWEAAVGPNPPLPQKQPLAVPPGNPVPFAVPPPVGSYWPIKTTSKEGRLVSYTASDGSIEGRPGRMFLGNREGRGDKAGVPRWHVGVDLFANIGDVVVACEDGTIVEFAPFYPAKSGQMTYRLLIEHSTAVVNYGEVTKDSLTRNQLRVGMRVRAGQPVAFVSDTSMLHFETYIIGTTRNYRWWKNGERPRQLLNPTKYLLFLQQYGLPQQTSVSTPAPRRQVSTSIQAAGKSSQGPFGVLSFAAKGHPRFTYTFTPEDAEWTARFLLGEAGGKNNPDNQAVLWAMFNRYALFTNTKYHTFHSFLRNYSTPLQPVLHNWRAAQRHIQNPKFVRTGGTYDPPAPPGIPRGQLQRFISLQQTPWEKLPLEARTLAERALRGEIPNPGIGIASEFANTAVYFRQAKGRGPTYEEWRQYTEELGRKKKWTWVGDVPHLQQMKVNAFFIDNRVKHLNANVIRVKQQYSILKQYV